MGHEMYTIAGAEPLPTGKVSVQLVFDYDGGGSAKAA